MNKRIEHKLIKYAARILLTTIFVIAISIVVTLMAYGADSRDLASITTEWKAIGANHKIIVMAYEDPDIPEITCYFSQAKTGGIAGAVGLAEDPSNFALSCVAKSTPTPTKKLPKEEQLFAKSTNIWFKSTRVTRIYDTEKNTVVYLATSRHLIDGSPFNAISAVPIR